MIFSTNRRRTIFIEILRAWLSLTFGSARLPPAIPTEVPTRRIGLAVRILLAHFFSEPVAARALIQRRRDAAHS